MSEPSNVAEICSGDIAQTNPKLYSLCGCYQATKSYTDLVTAYQKQQEEWAIRMASYERYKQAFSAWASKDRVMNGDQVLADYTMWKGVEDNTPFFTNTCFKRPSRGVCTAKVTTNIDTDNVCRQEAAERKLPYADEYRTTEERRGCSGKWNDGCQPNRDGYSRMQKWECRRSDEMIQNARNRYTDACPKTDPVTNQVWGSGTTLGAPPAAPQPPGNTNILCCSQIFTNIQTDGGDVDFDNISQKCTQELTTSITNAASTPETTTPETTTPATTTPETTTPATTTPETTTPETTTPATTTPETTTPVTTTPETTTPATTTPATTTAESPTPPMRIAAYVLWGLGTFLFLLAFVLLFKRPGFGVFFLILALIAIAVAIALFLSVSSD